MPLPQPDLHHSHGVRGGIQQGGGPHARLRVRPAGIHADVRVERTHKEVLDRRQLEKAMAVAIEGGEPVAEVGNRSGFVRWLLNAYIKVNKEAK